MFSSIKEKRKHNLDKLNQQLKTFLDQFSLGQGKMISLMALARLT